MTSEQIRSISTFEESLKVDRVFYYEEYNTDRGEYIIYCDRPTIYADADGAILHAEYTFDRLPIKDKRIIRIEVQCITQDDVDMLWANNMDEPWWKSSIENYDTVHMVQKEL